MKENSSNSLTKATQTLILLGIIFYVIYIANQLLIPLFLGLLIAVILFPLVRFFNQKLKFPNILAVGVAILIGLGLLVLLFFVLSQQFVAVFRDLPEIKHNLNIHLHALQGWMKNTFHVSLENQVKLVESVLTDKELLRGKSIPSIQPLTNGLLNVVLVPLYTFFILLYRQVFIGFFHRLFPTNSTQQKVDEIIENSLQVIRQYITGLIIQMFTVAFLTGFGLYIIGVKQFVFLGILAGILNLIPYIGIWTSLLVSILMALVGSPDLGIIIKVVVTFIIVQLIDGNILLPIIVGSKVRVNALATLLVILIGGTLAGVGGMFLALPTLAILKVVFDHVESLKPYGYLIGDGSEESSDYLSTVTSFLKSIPEKIKPFLKKGGKK